MYKILIAIFMLSVCADREAKFSIGFGGFYKPDEFIEKLDKSLKINEESKKELANMRNEIKDCSEAEIPEKAKKMANKIANIMQTPQMDQAEIEEIYFQSFLLIKNSNVLVQLRGLNQCLHFLQKNIAINDVELPINELNQIINDIEQDIARFQNNIGVVMLIDWNLNMLATGYEKNYKEKFGAMMWLGGDIVNRDSALVFAGPYLGMQYKKFMFSIGFGLGSKIHKSGDDYEVYKGIGPLVKFDFFATEKITCSIVYSSILVPIVSEPVRAVHCVAAVMSFRIL